MKSPATTSEMQQQLTRTVFSFGSPCASAGQYGHMVLRADGSIYGYSHANEARWSFTHGRLIFHSTDGRATSEFVNSGGNVWLGRVAHTLWPLYLMPLIELPLPQKQPPLHPSIFVNTVPKAGTYFVEAALNNVRIPSIRLHLSGQTGVDDYRGLPDDQIHRSPEKAHIDCPTHLITRLLSGEHAVGHIGNSDVLNTIREQHVTVISVVRNLRDVLASMFHFKRQKVVPVEPTESLWRRARPEAQFVSFLHYFRLTDIAIIASLAKLIAADENALVLRFEQLPHATFDKRQRDQLDAIAPDFCEKFARGLRAAHLQPTPTYFGRRSSTADIWSDDAEHFFVESGLGELNAGLGYEFHTNPTAS